MGEGPSSPAAISLARHIAECCTLFPEVRFTSLIHPRHEEKYMCSSCPWLYIYFFLWFVICISFNVCCWIFLWYPCLLKLYTASSYFSNLHCIPLVLEVSQLSMMHLQLHQLINFSSEMFSAVKSFLGVWNWYDYLNFLL